jgi:hypothetical protein
MKKMKRKRKSGDNIEKRKEQAIKDDGVKKANSDRVSEEGRFA